MDVRDALTKRKSVRAFTNESVSREQVERILCAARHAPSGTNTQPWQVVAVSGEAKAKLDTQLEAAFDEAIEENMDYIYYPLEWVEPYKSRRRACGLQMYTTLQITREDKARQRAQWRLNYSAFGAPVALYFFIDPVMKTGSFMDYGMFLQSIMLAAVEEGLATCAQAALGQYPDIVKSALKMPAEATLLCGMALGYEDTDADVNSYRTPREPVEVFTQFFGF
ncbi:nitroreductase [Teredinibacter turnerae]|uniref:nitroreductase n=1 Tax=Teredinibacter turnerae TaxID=2426 RepID=UPI0003A5F1A6|nr:nitroreductase [Teredinibacter turnerae]